MADIGNRLLVKFGLVKEPNAEQQVAWAATTRTLIGQGYNYEAAGELAARQLFSDFRRYGYKSEGDTIEMLLRQIADK